MPKFQLFSKGLILPRNTGSGFTRTQRFIYRICFEMLIKAISSPDHIKYNHQQLHHVVSYLGWFYVMKTVNQMVETKNTDDIDEKRSWPFLLSAPWYWHGLSQSYSRTMITTVRTRNIRKTWPSAILSTLANIDDMHYNDVIMSTIASQISGVTIVYSTVSSGINQRKHQSSASLASCAGIHRRPVNSPHKCPVTRKMFRFDDVIMWSFHHLKYILKQRLFGNRCIPDIRSNICTEILQCCSADFQAQHPVQVNSILNVI